MTRTPLILALLSLVALMESPLCAENAINVALQKGDRLQAEVTFGGKKVGEIDKTSDHDGVDRVPFFTCEVPTNPDRIGLRGVVTINGKDWPFDESWRTVDMAKLTGSLHAKDKPLQERIADYCEMLKSMEAKHEDEFYGADHSIDKRDGDAAAMLAATEARLGVKFPPAMKFLAEYNLELGDSGSLPPNGWKTVEQVLRDWGDTVPFAKAKQERFSRSIAVFLEIGDGPGLMAWDPMGVAPGEPSNVAGDDNGLGAIAGKPGEGVWFWLHQDEMEAELLLDRNRRPRDTESAVMSAIERLGDVEVAMDDLFELGEFGDIEGDDLIWVDSSNPRGMLLLFFDTQDEKLKVTLRYARYAQFWNLW